MTNLNLIETCHRCGCQRGEHYDDDLMPSRCHGECGIDCREFRNKGEDMSSINRLLTQIRNEANAGKGAQ